MYLLAGHGPSLPKASCLIVERNALDCWKGCHCTLLCVSEGKVQRECEMGEPWSRLRGQAVEVIFVPRAEG